MLATFATLAAAARYTGLGRLGLVFDGPDGDFVAVSFADADELMDDGMTPYTSAELRAALG